MTLKSSKLRESARLETCTVGIPTVCNHDRETTVLAHLTWGNSAMGGKPDDFSACYACSSCHDVIDRRRPLKNIPTVETYQDLYWYLGRAMVRTWQRMIEKGLIHIRGAK